MWATCLAVCCQMVTLDKNPGHLALGRLLFAILVLDMAQCSQRLCSYYTQGVALSTSRLVFGSIKMTDVKINNKLL